MEIFGVEVNNKEDLKRYYEIEDRARKLEQIVKNTINNKFKICVKSEVIHMDSKSKMYQMALTLKLIKATQKKYITEYYDNVDYLYDLGAYITIEIPFDFKDEDITEDYLTSIIRNNETYKLRQTGQGSKLRICGGYLDLDLVEKIMTRDRELGI